MFKSLIILVLCLVVTPCFAEESVTERAYREAEESNQRIRENMDRWNDGMDTRTTTVMTATWNIITRRKQVGSIGKQRMG
jgi:hypothetical protein